MKWQGDEFLAHYLASQVSDRFKLPLDKRQFDYKF